MRIVSVTVSRTGNNMVSPGRNKAAEINRKIAALASGASETAKETLVLLAGNYTLEAPIVAGNHVILTGEGADTVLIPTFTGDADDPTNAVILAVGEVDDDTLDTTLSAVAIKGASSVTVADAGSIAAGDYVLFTGENDVEDALGAELEEVVRVADSYESGTTLPLAWATYQHHSATTVTVTAVDPVVGFQVRDLAIRGSQDDVVTACGIYAKHAVDLEFHGITGEGFSRAAIDVEGCTRWRSSGYYHRGGSNGRYFLSSTCGFDVWGFDGSGQGDRVHSEGVPRFEIYMRRRCSDGRIHDGTLAHGNAGIFHSGGVNLSFESIHIRDMEASATAYARWVASGEQQDGGTLGLGFGSGHGPLAIAEYAFGCTWSNITVEDLRAPNAAGWNDAAPRRACAAYIHDTRKVSLTNIVCSNWINTSIVGGVVVSDADGALTNLTVKGLPYGLSCVNFLNDLKVTNYRFEGSRGGSPVAPVPLYLNYDPTSNRGVSFNGFHCTSAFSFVAFGAGFVFDRNLQIRDVITEQGAWSYAIVARNETGVSFTVGDIVEIDPTHTGTYLRVRTPDTGSTDYAGRLAVVVSGLPDDAGTGWLFIAPLPQDYASVTASSGAVAYGDRIGYAATRRAETSNGAAQPIGIARTRKAAGSEGGIVLGVTA